MKKLTIYDWEWPDTQRVPDGYDMKNVPVFSADNFLFLIKKYNELAEVIENLGTNES